MQILILGATGRTGKQLLDLALLKGYAVNVLVRDKNKLKSTSAQLNVFEGIPTDPLMLGKAMYGCQAVLSTLNVSRSSDFPWAKLRTPTDFLSATMKNIISLAGKTGIKRIIVVSAWGVNETRKEIPGWFRWMIDHSNIRYPYLDHGIQEELLKATTLDWTILRPSGLNNSKKEKKVKVSFNANPKPGLMISRLMVAKFMLDTLQNHSYIRQSPTIST